MKLFKTLPTTILALLIVLSLFSCSDDDSSNGKVSPDKFKSQLCFGGKFTVREYEQRTFSQYNLSYSSMTEQTDYYFKNDGTGEKETILMTTSGRGYSTSKTTFDWTVEGGESIVLRIMPSSGNVLTLSNCLIDNEFLKAENETLYKEIPYNKKLKKEDITEYSVEGLNLMFGNSEGRPVILYTPTLLTIKTKSGIIRIPTRGKGIWTSGMPAYGDGYGNAIPYDNKIYLEVQSGEYVSDVMALMENHDFPSQGKYFYIGAYDSNNRKIEAIENGKAYQINN